MSSYHIDTAGLHNYLQERGLVSPRIIYISPEGLSFAKYSSREVVISSSAVESTSDSLLDGLWMGEPNSPRDYMNPSRWPYILAYAMGNVVGYTPHSHILNDGYSLIQEPDETNTREFVFSTLLAHEIGHLQRGQLAGFLFSIAGTGLVNAVALNRIVERPEKALQIILGTTFLSVASMIIGRAILELKAIDFTRDHVENLKDFVQVNNSTD